MWYEQAAKKLEEALPLGNGRLGAMIYGGVEKERLQLNEESLWAGRPFETYPDNFKENLRINPHPGGCRRQKANSYQLSRRDLAWFEDHQYVDRF